MKIETLQNRIEGAIKRQAKLEAKIVRIEKAKASNWTNNPYYYHESDLVSAQRELNSTIETLASYREQLAKEIEKANSRNVPAILEFLENWKKNVHQWYMRKFDEYYAEQKHLESLRKEAGWEVSKEYDEAYKALRQKCRGYYENRPYERYGRTWNAKVKVKDGEYESIMTYVEYNSKEEAEAKLLKDIEDNANAMYDDIIERTNKIVGEITDASYLHVGDKGELNGFVFGTRGKAKVQTITAGGYNIQCFHFRTLIHKI